MEQRYLEPRPRVTPDAGPVYLEPGEYVYDFPDPEEAERFAFEVSSLGGRVIELKNGKLLLNADVALPYRLVRDSRRARECPECQGEGEVTITYGPGRPVNFGYEQDERTIRCEACAGMGIV